MTVRTILDTARALAPLMLSLRAQTERDRRPPPALVEALIDAQLFRLAVPREQGGLEASPLDALCMFEELASSEAAVAWLVWNNTLPALMSRHLSPAARSALFGPRTVLANSTRPTGRAVRERDGFRVSGRWALVSGCELADVLLLRALVEPLATPPEMIMAYLPRRACEIVDTWHAGGLRGTGSHDVIVDAEWIPVTHCVSFTQPLQLGSALYAMPFAATLSAGCASLCLGIARSALHTLLELGRAKQLTDRGAALRDQPTFLTQLAAMQAEHAAARMLLHAVVSEAWRTSQAGAPVTMEERARIWQAAHHAASAAKRVVRKAYELAGASALFESCPIERAHRDLHAAAQHIILQEAWLEDAGRVALGGEPLAPLFAS
jgi:indole-3-acetate monooxygenase